MNAASLAAIAASQHTAGGGGGSPTVRGVATKAGNGTSVSIVQSDFNIPPNGGDTVLFFVVHPSDTKTSSYGDAGFITIDFPNLTTERRVAGGAAGSASTDGAYTVTESASQGYPMLMVALAIGGATVAAPDAHATNSGSTPTAPSISPTGSTDLLVCGFGVMTPLDTLAQSITGPGGMTNIAEVKLKDPVGGTVTSHLLVAYQTLSSSGATGTRTATWSGGAATFIGGSVAFK